MLNAKHKSKSVGLLRPIDFQPPALYDAGVTYEAALEWLFAQTRAGAPRGLGRIQELLEALGHPEQAFDAIHVIGTNGKGGVVAYLEAGFKSAYELSEQSAGTNNASSSLEAAFQATAKPYGVTTSPHLVDFRERIRTQRGLISEAEVVAFVEWAKGRAWLEPMAFFDFATALAFKHFAQAKVQIAAVEAGVGGLLDDTNVLPRVCATVLTSVGEDHLETLGGSVEAVAYDKAGAIRPGVPVVSGFAGVGKKVVQEIAAERGAPLYELESQDPLFDLPAEPSLRGAFQRRNARLATATLRLLGYPEAVIVAGLTQAVHPGRMQEVWLEGVRMILDGAHNPPAAFALAQEFEAYHLVYGGFPRKDYHTVLGYLLPKAHSVRYAKAGKGALREQLQAEYEAPYFEDALEALEDALKLAQQDRYPVLVTGSLYLVGAILAGS